MFPPRFGHFPVGKSVFPAEGASLDGETFSSFSLRLLFRGSPVSVSSPFPGLKREMEGGAVRRGFAGPSSEVGSPCRSFAGPSTEVGSPCRGSAGPSSEVGSPCRSFAGRSSEVGSPCRSLAGPSSEVGSLIYTGGGRPFLW